MTEPKLTTTEYNNIPVHYCSRCKSLKIKYIDEDDIGKPDAPVYCTECGCTEITQGHISELQEPYEDKGIRFLTPRGKIKKRILKSFKDGKY